MVPPRRSLKDLLVPRDATETARQGQGIGDLEAIMQMATTAIPEALRVAPATSTPMSLFDTANALADRDYAGAGMAALGAIPFAGALKYADEVADVAKSAMRGAKSLPMDTPSRMARAAEQGFTRDVYHGTRAQNIAEFNRSKVGEFGPAVYTTTSPAEAGSYAIHHGANTRSGAPNVLPLKAKIENPIEVKSADEFWGQFGHLGKSDDEVIAALKAQGHGGIVIRRPVEVWDEAARKSVPTGETQEHVVVFDPSNIRSRFAKFDPANIGKAGLMGALAGTLGMSAANNRNAKGSK